MEDDFAEYEPVEIDQEAIQKEGVVGGLIPDAIRISIGAMMTEDGVTRVGMMQFGFRCPVHGMEWEAYAISKSLAREIREGMAEVEEHL